jgi:hypothetical protein
MLLTVVALVIGAHAQNEVRVTDSAELIRAASSAKPGARILLEPGVYAGGIHIANLHGTATGYILISGADPKKPPRIVGGGSALQLSDVAYVQLRDLVIERPLHNGLNIDDGGSIETPSHHVTLKNIVVRETPAGNNDGIKLSGLNDFLLHDCRVEKWGGSAVDMVGCHRGSLVGCTFKDGGDSGVQCKGGTSGIRISSSNFENFGQRGVNIGGSTGLQFFRPPLEKMPLNGRYEAKDILVLGCTFVGGVAPFAFVGVDGALVRQNTIYRPGRWAIRILQETRNAGFVPSRNGVFTENLIVFRSDSWASGGVNIGPGTKPESFRFSRNFWFCEDQPPRSRPSLPTEEQNGVYGQDPLLDENLRPKAPSAAGKVGAHSFTGS